MLRARFEREREAIYVRLGEAIRASLAEDQIAPIDDALAECFGHQSIGKFADTREMRFFLSAVEAFTPCLIRRLQRLLKEEFPKWSVVPQYEECEFTVFPSHVRFGDILVQEDVTTETTTLREWQVRAIEIREQKYGPLRRQLGWLRSRMKDSLNQLSTSQVVILGVFGHSRWGGHAVWMLERPEAVLGLPGSVDVLPESIFTSAPESYPVDAHGTIHPMFTREYRSPGGKGPAAWLLLFHNDSKDLPNEVEVYRRTPQYDADDNFTGTERSALLCRVPLPPPMDDRVA